MAGLAWAILAQDHVGQDTTLLQCSQRVVRSVCVFVCAQLLVLSSFSSFCDSPATWFLLYGEHCAETSSDPISETSRKHQWDETQVAELAGKKWKQDDVAKDV